MTMSSAFSGIGAPEQSVHDIRSYLSHAVPGTPTMVRQIAACDWNSFSRAELAHSASPPEHIFSNIVEFISPSVRDYVVDKANCAQWTAKSLWAYLSQPGVMTLRAFCSCCRAPCKYMRARIHVAGTPCIEARREASWHPRRVVCAFILVDAFAPPLAGRHLHT